MPKDLFGFLRGPLNKNERDFVEDRSYQDLEVMYQKRIFDDLTRGIYHIFEGYLGEAGPTVLPSMNHAIREWIQSTWLFAQTPFVRKRLGDILEIELVQTGENSTALNYPDSVKKLANGEQAPGFLADFYSSFSQGAMEDALIEHYNKSRKVELLKKIESGETLTQAEHFFKVANAIVKKAYSSPFEKDESDFIDILKAFSVELAK